MRVETGYLIDIWIDADVVNAKVPLLCGKTTLMDWKANIGINKNVFEVVFNGVREET